MKSRMKEQEEVDITPMIDIVFQLIIFFMVAMSIAMVYGISIKFPSGGSGKEPKKVDSKEEKVVMVFVAADFYDSQHQIKRDGELKLNNETIPLWDGTDPKKQESMRDGGYKYLRQQIRYLIAKEGYSKDKIFIQGDVDSYHGKIVKVIDQAKSCGIKGFSLVPPHITE
ncbi:MAG: biopolymer transporter ExbD, partial [bacterium]